MGCHRSSLSGVISTGKSHCRYSVGHTIVNLKGYKYSCSADTNPVGRCIVQQGYTERIKAFGGRDGTKWPSGLPE